MLLANPVQHGRAEFMRMLIKVRGGTPADHGDALCETCRHANIVRGQRLAEQIVFCKGMSYEPVRITFRVHACSEYEDDRQPTYQELVQQAWILRPATRRRTAGFVHVRELGDDEAAAVFEDPTEKE